MTDSGFNRLGGDIGGKADEIQMIFPVPVITWEMPHAASLFDRLFKAVEARKAQDPGIARSNDGGWHSALDLPGWPDSAVRSLVSWVVGRVDATSRNWRDGLDMPLAPHWRLNGWVNINRRGHSNDLHKHSAKNWHWSAVYYLQAGGAGKGGRLIFEDVGSGLEPAGSSSRSAVVEPRQGTLVVFPSWLYHRVEPHEDDTPRISFAFNLHNQGLDRARLWTHRKNICWRKLPWLMSKWARLLGRWDQSGPATPPGFDIETPRNEREGYCCSEDLTEKGPRACCT